MESYEQKYKEALERAETLIEKLESTHIKGFIYHIFPELQESEDEKIKREIVAYINELADLKNEKIPTKWLTWLEKQGENKQEPVQKPFDYEHATIHQKDFAPKDEPKFKVGDLIKHNKANIICKVISVNSGSYYVENIETSGRIEFFNAEQNFHLWTINDAKDGDVLFCKGNIKNSNEIKYERICLFNNLDNAFFTLTKTSNYVEEYDIDVNIDYPDNTIPSTKEQRDLLFAKMKEAGYEWNAENKELKKIESLRLK